MLQTEAYLYDGKLRLQTFIVQATSYSNPSGYQLVLIGQFIMHKFQKFDMKLKHIICKKKIFLVVLIKMTKVFDFYLTLMNQLEKNHVRNEKFLK